MRYVTRENYIADNRHIPNKVLDIHEQYYFLNRIIANNCNYHKTLKVSENLK